MAWTEFETAELKRMAFDEASNEVIATALKKPITEIYAKRSALGITIPKIKAIKAARVVEGPYPAEAQPGPDHPKPTIEQRVTADIQFRQKKQVIGLLARALYAADKTIVDVSTIGHGSHVQVRYENGAVYNINIECDSLLAIIYDVICSCKSH